MQRIRTFVGVFGFMMAASAFAKSAVVSEGYFVNDPQKQWLALLSKKMGLTIDHVSQTGYEVWGGTGTLATLKSLNLSVGSKMQTVAGHIAADYPSPEQVESQLKTLAAKNTQLTKLFSIGKSEQGRELWCIRLSKAVGDQTLKLPEVKYIANMHGDEILGRELMLKFVADLIENYGKDENVTRLLETTDVYIIPSMNPDGAALRRRGNASFIDLNRDFPDFSTSDNRDTPQGRAIETQAVMAFQKQHKFVLSANFHGGAEVVNYPWDTTDERHPEENWMKQVSLLYAGLVSYITDSGAFPQGIVRGYDWYEVDGGMQDWSYYWYRDKQVTIELAQSKWPPFREVDYYYRENRNALIQYLLAAPKP